MTDKVFYVYAHYKKDTNEIFYIGKGTVTKNGKYNRAHTSFNRSKFWTSIAKKHGFYAKILYESSSEVEAFKKECELIKFYGRKENNGCLCNLTDGGEGAVGVIPSIETRLKIGAGNKGKIVSNETRIKLSVFQKGIKKLSISQKEALKAANIGRKHSEETKIKISISSKGRLHSEETKIKMSILKRELNKKKVIDIKTGIVYGSIKEAAEAINVKHKTLSAYLTGQCKNKTSMRYL